MLSCVIKGMVSSDQLWRRVSPLPFCIHNIIINHYGSPKFAPALDYRLSNNMPISMDQWRASVGSNNAARAHVFSKIMNKCSRSPGSFLSQLFMCILALIRTRTDNGEVFIHMCAWCVHCVHVCVTHT